MLPVLEKHTYDIQTRSFTSRDWILRWVLEMEILIGEALTIKYFPSMPEALLTEVNVAIAALEYAHANAVLDPSSSPSKSNNPIPNSGSVYDALIAEEAYKLGCTALSEGKIDEGLYSLDISLSKCPPDETDAIAKIQSLISLAARHFKTFK